MNRSLIGNLRLIGIAAALACVAGCNTVQGVGEDITAGGRKVEDVLKKDQPASDSSVSPPSPTEPATGQADKEHTGRASASPPPADTSTQ